MGIWQRLFRTGATQPAPQTQDEIVNKVSTAMVSHEKARSEGTFETSGKNLKSIICSDDECPCTDQKPLVPGQSAYLYISPGVVNFRKDCLSVLELEMKVSRMKAPQEIVRAISNSMPKFVCEVGAKRRGLDLSVALADGVAAVQTGFVPLRATPLVSEIKNPAQKKDEEQALQILVADLMSSDRATREGALVAARSLASTGTRRAVDALEIAIRRKAGSDSVEFHTPGLAIGSADNFTKARETLLEIAGRGEICKEAKRVGSLMAWLNLQGGDSVRTLLSDIRQAGGEEQVHQFQLVGTHLQAVAAYRMRGHKQ